MTKIYLYGSLGEKFGPEYDLDVGSVTEAVRALTLTKEGFATEVENGVYQIFVGDPDSDDHEELEEGTIHLRTHRDIHIFPVIEGSKRKGLGKTIIGAILMVASFFIPVPGLNNLIFNIGMSMMLRGISMMLSPQPDKDSTPDSLFQNDPMSAQQGTPIPVLYGEMLCDLIPISLSVEADKKDATRGLDYGNTYTGPTIIGTDGVSTMGTHPVTGWQLFSVTIASQL